MRNLNLPQLISVLANVAVLGGLIFLGHETRQNTIQLRAAASYSITEGLHNLNSGVYANREFADIINRGEQDLASLDSIELARFSSFQFDRLNLAIHIQVLEDDGVVDVQFPYIDFLVKEFHRKPGLQQFIELVEDTWVGDPKLYERLRINN